MKTVIAIAITVFFFSYKEAYILLIFIKEDR
nr:MAG TPA: hypothetical protein [Caudoviricetes sp.]